MSSTEQDKEPLKVLFEKSADNIQLQALAPTDKLKLFIKVNCLDKKPPPSENPITEAQLLKLLEGQVADALLDRAVLADIVKNLNEKGVVEQRRIAKGKLAEQGTNGKLLLLVKKYAPANQIEVKEESAPSDLRNLHRFDNIVKGQIVGRLYPPKPGAGGMDITGKEIVAKPGAPAKITFDPSVILKKDPAEPTYELICAEADGYLLEENGKLSVKPELYIKGDVDFSHGNLDFVGKIVIKGDVMPGFQVRAKCGIEVGGTVRAASLISPAGDIVVKGFVHGGEKSSVVCGANFRARGLTGADVEARGEIFVEKEITSSRIKTQSTIRAANARLFGGESEFVCGAEFSVLGNESGVGTNLRFCSDVEATVAYSDLQTRIRDHEKGIELLKLHLGPLADNPAKLRSLSAAHRSKMDGLLKKLSSVVSSYQKLLEQKVAMVATAKVSEQSVVNVQKTLHLGVNFLASDVSFKVAEEKKGPLSVKYVAESKQFSYGAVEAIVCPPSVPKASESQDKKQEN